VEGFRKQLEMEDWNLKEHLAWLSDLEVIEVSTKEGIE
jgi:hypothetical protein